MRSSLVEIEELTRQHRARENRPQNKCVVQAPGRHAAAPRQAGRRRPPRPATSGTGASAAQRRAARPPHPNVSLFIMGEGRRALHMIRFLVSLRGEIYK